MILLEIPANSNCPAVEQVFHEAGAVHPIQQVRLEREAGCALWYDVTGWTAEGQSCAALLQKVDDSGEGVAFLVRGGTAGLRLRPAGAAGPWQLRDADQWGEPFLLLADPADVRPAVPFEP